MSTQIPVAIFVDRYARMSNGGEAGGVQLVVLGGAIADLLVQRSRSRTRQRHEILGSIDELAV